VKARVRLAGRAVEPSLLDRRHSDRPLRRRDPIEAIV
jgi:hypothetical protein